MNKEFKQKWIYSLRSGKYTQGQQALRRKDEFCCLGVACDIYDDSKWEKEDGKLYNYLSDGRSYGAELPHEIAEEIELSEDDQDHLVGLNDGLCYNFREIADWIESNL